MTLPTLAALWYLLLPLGVVVALLARAQPVQRAARLGLIEPRAQSRLRLALVFCGGVIVAGLGALFLETSLWLPIAMAVMLVGITLLLCSAAGSVHPALYGFNRPIPLDGVQALGSNERQIFGAGWRVWTWRLAPVALLLLGLMLGAATAPRRLLTWAAVAPLALLPAALIAARRAWVAPLLWLPVSIFLGWRATTLQPQLPPGNWVTPWTAADCAAHVEQSGDGTAWCVNSEAQTVTRFHLASRIVLDYFEYEAVDNWQVAAANPDGAWIRQHTTGQMVYASAGGEPITFDLGVYPVTSAVTDAGDLWVVDELHSLHVYRRRAGGVEDARIGKEFVTDWPMVVDVLQDQSVWVGTINGIGQIALGSDEWKLIGHGSNLLMPVFDMTSNPEGTVWFLQVHQYRPSWGVSVLRPNGEWTHTDLRELTKLRFPRNCAKLAVDGRGRLWFTAEGRASTGKYLGVLNPDGTLAYPMYSLGKFKTAGPFGLGSCLGIDSYGVFSVGAGGIYLYNGTDEPLRHWLP